uniref:Cell shape-determining protein MreC n=1 Tax=freshwater metagenome TaxID=449393 RepID=A0A6J5YWU3_9ZZZZ
MYDRTIRRRRLTLVALLACALLLLSVYVGESSSGPLHSVQRGVFSVFTPVQEGASRVLKPARDLFGWIGDTVNAKSRLAEVESSNRQLRSRAIAGSEALRVNAQLQKLLNLNQANGLAAASPVAARVIGRSPTLWYGTVTIDQGSSRGIRVGNPVITGDGLAGQVSTVTGHAAVVTLISDGEMAVPARISGSGAQGVAQTGAGGPNDLRLKFIARRFRADPGASVVTAGTLSNSPKLQSLYPPGIPIGSVTRVVDPGTDAQKIFVRPYADLQRLEIVQVLTRRINGNRP